MQLAYVVQVDISDPAAFNASPQGTGLLEAPFQGQFLTPLAPEPELAIEFTDAATTLSWLPGRPRSDLPWLPAELFDAILEGRKPDVHVKGPDDTSSLSRQVRRTAFRRAVEEVVHPPRAIPELSRLVLCAIGLAFRLGVQEDATTEDLRKFARGVIDSDPGAIDFIEIKIPELVGLLYREGSPFGAWAELARDVEEEARQAREAAAQAAREAEAAAARDEEIVEVAASEIAGCDAVMVAKSSDHISAGPERWQPAFVEARRTEDGTLVRLLNNDGIRPGRDVEIAHGLVMKSADRVTFRMRRRDLRSKLMIPRRTSTWVGRFINDTRDIDRRPLTDEKSRTRRDPEVAFALEQAAVAAADLFPAAMSFPGSCLSEDNYEQRRAVCRIVDKYRIRGLHKELAIAAIEKAAAAYIAEGGRCAARRLWTAEGVRHRVEKVYAGGDQTEVSPGSLIEVPPTPWMDRFLAKFPSFDKWRKPLLDFVGNRDIVGADVQRFIRDTFTGGREVSPTERQRVFAIMTRAGFEKRQRTQPDGSRANTWTRAKDDEDRGTSEMIAAAPSDEMKEAAQ